MRTLCKVQLQQLAYFVAVAEVRHFTQAAEILRVAQPSLSKQIRALEAELRSPLFSRARGNITLTPAGEVLLPLAKRILADVETARLEVQELAGLKRGRVRLGATPSLCAGLLADVLRRFHDAYPGIQLLVEEGGSRDLVRELTRRFPGHGPGHPAAPRRPSARHHAHPARGPGGGVADRGGGGAARALPQGGAAAAPFVPAHRGPAEPPAGDVPSRLRPAGGDDQRVPRRRFRAQVRGRGRRDGRGPPLRGGRPRGRGGPQHGSRRTPRLARNASRPP